MHLVNFILCSILTQFSACVYLYLRPKARPAPVLCTARIIGRFVFTVSIAPFSCFLNGCYHCMMITAARLFVNKMPILFHYHPCRRYPLVIGLFENRKLLTSVMSSLTAFTRESKAPELIELPYDDQAHRDCQYHTAQSPTRKPT